MLVHSAWALAAHLIAEPCPAAEDAAYELNAEITAQRSDAEQTVVTQSPSQSATLRSTEASHNVIAVLPTDAPGESVAVVRYCGLETCLRRVLAPHCLSYVRTGRSRECAVPTV